MDPIGINSTLRNLLVGVRKKIDITNKVMETTQGLEIYNVPIRELSHSLKCLRSFLQVFYTRNTAAPRQVIATAGVLSDIKSLLHEINLFFETSPTKTEDTIKCQDQLYDYHRRITEKILVFKTASLNGELVMIQSLLLAVGILSPRMPLLHSGSNQEQHQRPMSERTVPNSSKNGSDVLLFMSCPVQEGLFVGYYTPNDEPGIGGGGPTRLILRLDLKMKIFQEEGEGLDLTGYFRVEMGQFDNRLQTASLRNYSFVKTYKADRFPWHDHGDGSDRRRLLVQKWQFGGEWRDKNLDMDCAECLGNFLIDEVDKDLTLDGEWYGFYFGGGEQEPSDQPFHLTMQTIRMSERVATVTGEGADQHGMFDISGRLFQDALVKKLEFEKVYFSYDDGRRVNRHRWDYNGYVEVGGRGVTGTWGRSSRHLGSFSMARVD